MSSLFASGATTLAASTLLMLLVLAVRATIRRRLGPRIGYALWLLPAARMIVPWLPLGAFQALPVAGAVTGRMSILAIGPRGAAALLGKPALATLGGLALAIWAIGAVGLFAIYAIRHSTYCRRLRSEGADYGRIGRIRIVTADVDGPLAFGVVRRFVAVPHDFARDYDAQERELALAHECAHHARGDLALNWIALVMLACHWWNPVAWVAMTAFRDDQEYAADADVLAGAGPAAVPAYARLLAKAAGFGAPPACHLHTRHTLKGRLIMLSHKPQSLRRALFGGTALFLLGGAALAATVGKTDASSDVQARQAVTIGVKPDGRGAYALIVGGTVVAPGAPLPHDMILPADFSGAGGCDLTPAAKPFAMAIKGADGVKTYTVLCASATPAPLRTTLVEGIASLETMRAMVATQHEPPLPEAERAHALGAIDRSIREVEATLARVG